MDRGRKCDAAKPRPPQAVDRLGDDAGRAGAVIAKLVEFQREVEDMIEIHAEIGPEEILERPIEHARACHESERQRDLDDDQAVSHPVRRDDRAVGPPKDGERLPVTPTAPASDRTPARWRP